MSRCLLVAVVCCLFVHPVWAIPESSLSPGEQCRAAIAAAERGHAIPPQLLAAIGRVESGRRDPETGAWSAWPWTINYEGTGAWFESKAQAIQAVMGLQARGVRSIDVGCMQVNLMHHPNAFATLDAAFEPASNADYAARFLTELHEQSGDWTQATASYHSANPWEGDPYAAKVLAVWPEEQRKAASNPPRELALARATPMAGPITPWPVHQPVRMMPFTPSMPPAAYSGPGMLAMAQPRVFPFAGMTAGPTQRPVAAVPLGQPIPMGMIQASPPAALPPPPGPLPLGMMRAGSPPSGQLMPPGMMTAGAAYPLAMAGGRDLAAYRAMPIVAPPVRMFTRALYPIAMR